MLAILRLLTVFVVAGTILAFTTGDRFGIVLGLLLIGVCLLSLRFLLGKRRQRGE